MNLYYLHYNNYYNRILKREETLADYLAYEVARTENRTFNPNDGVSTVATLNFAPVESIFPDYVVAAEGTTIMSRWFVIESKRTRAHQYDVVLRRDLLADFSPEYMRAPMFVEKGWLPEDDVAIYNTENFVCNEIKTGEALLRDQTACPWIVGYYDKTATADELTGPVDIKNDNLVYTQLTGGLNSWEYYSWLTNDFHDEWVENNAKIRIKFGTQNSQLMDGFFGYIDRSPSGIMKYTRDTSVYPTALNLKYEVGNDAAVRGIYIQDIINAIIAASPKTTKELFTLAEAYAPNPDPETVQTYLDMDKKLLRDVNGKFYRIRLIRKDPISKTTAIPAGVLYDALEQSVINATISKYNIGKIFATKPNTSTFSIQALYPVYRLVAEETPEFEATFDLYNADVDGNSIQTQGTPYNIFAIPYGAIDITEAGDVEGDYYTIGSEEAALATAAAIQRKLQGNLYDIQLLPYFPYQDLIRGDQVIVVPNANTVSFVQNAKEKFTIIFNCPYAEFEARELYLDGDTIDLKVGATALERKVNRQCNKYRLASPNYSNYFDFSVELNNGVRRFTADCEYKPYQPYIHINPDFGGLYGKDYNDPRGLILGGDFSLTQVIDQWETYQINNKNYELIFGRQQQNLEVQQKYGKTQDIVNAITGTFSGATYGAFMGASMSGGNPYVAAATGIAGGMASLGAGIADVSMNEALRAEALDYARDMYEYNIQNIQALPTTLSKVSSINPNNKLYPVLEYYTATETEKEALRNKIRYNGMTIERIGTLNDFVNGIDVDDANERHYYKGKLIRVEDLADDYHVINALSGELNKGVFI